MNPIQTLNLTSTCWLQTLNLLKLFLIIVSTRSLAPPSAKTESNTTCEPSYKMLLEPTSSPEYLILEISLPDVVSICHNLGVF